jgi:hypothetical protein
MSPDSRRTTQSFIEECLDVFERGSASMCAAELGMAYRAWVDDPGLADTAVAEEVITATPPGTLTLIWIAGSLWIDGAQLSGAGNDMVSEGWLLHANTRPEGPAGARG